MKWNAITPVALATLLTPVISLAHTGHGTFTGHELAHYLTSPLHVAPTMIILVMVVLLWREYRKAATEKS